VAPSLILFFRGFPKHLDLFCFVGSCLGLSAFFEPGRLSNGVLVLALDSIFAYVFSAFFFGAPQSFCRPPSNFAFLDLTLFRFFIQTLCFVFFQTPAICSNASVSFFFLIHVDVCPRARSVRTHSGNSQFSDAVSFQIFHPLWRYPYKFPFSSSGMHVPRSGYLYLLLFVPEALRRVFPRDVSTDFSRPPCLASQGLRRDVVFDFSF